VVKNTDIEII